jgi:predicted nucleic acid-binding protein
VRLVVADTSPINYLLLVGYIEILPAMFDKVIVPAAVIAELSHSKAPAAVAKWVATLPSWVEVRDTHHLQDALLAMLGPGEEAAIALALEIHADLVLMDDAAGVRAARGRGLEATGTLGILSRAGQRRLLNLTEAYERVKRTNFRFRQEIMDQFLTNQDDKA